jgi:hypothetical protein
MTTTMTWDELVKLEPKLGVLLAEAQAVRDDDPHFCANAIWYDFLKPRLVLLVGWCRPDRTKPLASEQAYDVAYDTIYEALPDCRDCAACFRSELLNVK